jgi:hypothetical protein
MFVIDEVPSQGDCKDALYMNREEEGQIFCGGAEMKL